ncbi:protein FAM199X-like [Ornithodoros turicata]
MLEASILSTSPWNADPFLWKDAESVLGFDQLLPEKLDCLVEDDFESTDVSCPVSCSPPSPLRHVLDVQEESDYADILLDFSVAEEETNVSSVAGLDNLSLDVAVDSDWSSEPPSCCDDDPWMGMPKLTRPARLPDLLPVPRSKSWLLMTAEEQLRTVEALTEVISRRLDLREQVEVIRIIDPNAVLHPSDKEFVIDLKHLDDHKLRQIADYVQRHAADWERMDDGNTDPVSAGKRSRSQGTRSRNSGSTESSVTSEISAPLTKREARQRRRQHAKTWRQRKARQQLQKERRSGLFVNEQVLSLSENTASSFQDEDFEVDENEEVDILH